MLKLIHELDTFTIRQPDILEHKGIKSLPLTMICSYPFNGGTQCS